MGICVPMARCRVRAYQIGSGACCGERHLENDPFAPGLSCLSSHWKPEAMPLALKLKLALCSLGLIVAFVSTVPGTRRWPTSTFPPWSTPAHNGSVEHDMA